MIRLSHGLSAVTATTILGICVRTASLLPGPPGAGSRGPALRGKLDVWLGCWCMHIQYGRAGRPSLNPLLLPHGAGPRDTAWPLMAAAHAACCLLYTSDAADE